MDTKRMEKLLSLLSKEAYVPAGPGMDPMAGGMPPPMDPMAGGMDPMAGGMPPPMPQDPMAGGLPPMPPEMMSGAMPPPMPEGPPAEPESVTLSMADLKSILQDAVGEAKGGGVTAEKKRSTQELLETLEQKITNIEEQLTALTGDVAGGEAMPPEAMPPPNEIAALLGVPPEAMSGVPPMAPPMPPEAMPPAESMPMMPPEGVGGMPMDVPPEGPPGPPPLTDEALKTASESNRDRWLNSLQSERGAVKEALRLLQGYTR